MTTSKYDTMGKTELRAACKEAGIKYGKLDNAGMKAALVELDTPVPAPTSAPTNYAQILGLAPAPVVAAPTNGRKVIDGKPVEEKSKGNGTSTKSSAPAAPRVSRKGYTIQKEREERNGVKRPSEGTVCGAVWAEFDKNPEIKAGDLAELADANGWNRTNVSCEFYAWRKFMGIKGRVTK